MLTVDASAGSYTLSLLLTDPDHLVTTAPIAFDATADVVRQALQNAIVANDPRLIFRFDVMVDRYRDGLNRAFYVIGFQGNLRQNNDGIGANFLRIDTTGLTGGASLAKPLRASGQFPPLVTHMVEVGEQSGELEAMLGRVADTYDEQVETSMTRLTALLEPMLILLMVGMVLVIIFATLVPLLQVTSSLK